MESPVVDLVVNFTPVFSHAQVSTMAIEHGQAVFSEQLPSGTFRAIP